MCSALPGDGVSIQLLAFLFEFWLCCASSCYWSRLPPPPQAHSVSSPNHLPPTQFICPWVQNFLADNPVHSFWLVGSSGMSLVPFGSHPEGLPSVNCLFPNLLIPVGLLIVIAIKYYVNLERSVNRIGFYENLKSWLFWGEDLIKVITLKTKNKAVKIFCGPDI